MRLDSAARPAAPRPGLPALRVRVPRIGLALGLVSLTLLAGLARAGVDPPPRKTEVAIRGDGFLINGRPTYAGRTWQGPLGRGAAAQQPDGPGDLRRPEPRDPRDVGLPRHRPLGPRAEHPRVPRRHARVAAPRPARLHHQPPGRQPPGLLQGPPALAQLGDHRQGRAAARVHGPARPHPRPGRRAGDGRDPGRLLLRPGRAAGGRGGRAPRPRRRGRLGARPGLPQRPGRGRTTSATSSTTTRSCGPTASTS